MNRLSVLKSCNSPVLFSCPRLLFKSGKKVFIYGIYGVGNLGDEAILKGILDQLSIFKDIVKVVVSKKPEYIYNSYGVPSIHPWLYRKIACFLKKRNEGSLFIMGGGGIIKDYGNSHSALERFLSTAKVSLKAGFTNVLYSAGVENIRYQRSEEILVNVLSKFDILTVRDNNSKYLLEKIGINKPIYVTGDPAVFSFSRLTKKISDKSKRFTVLVSIRHWYEEGHFTTNKDIFANFITELALTLDSLIKKKNAYIIFIPFRKIPFDNDVEIIKKVISKMNSIEGFRIYDRVPSFDVLRLLYEQADIVIGMRLHSLIYSFSFLNPMVGISYSSKVKDFMSQIDMNDFCLDISALNSKILMDKIDVIIEKDIEIKTKMKKVRETYIRRTKKGFSLIRELF